MRCFEAAGVRITQSGLQETEPTIQTNVHPIESSKKLPLVNVQAVPIKSNLNQIQQQTWSATAGRSAVLHVRREVG